MIRLLSPFVMLCIVGLVARLGYQMARSPVLPRFAQDLGAAPELVGLIVGASTITGVFIKLPAGALSDVFGRRRVLVLGAAFFAFPPFLYPFVHTPEALLLLRFLHGVSTAIFSPVVTARIVGHLIKTTDDQTTKTKLLASEKQLIETMMSMNDYFRDTTAPYYLFEETFPSRTSFDDAIERNRGLIDDAVAKNSLEK
ncbi:MAG: MFS transporter, partial [Chloroflexota bacterium]